MKDGKVLVIRAIRVHYSLGDVDESDRATVERVHGFHADFCPVARSISPSIQVTTTYEFVD